MQKTKTDDEIIKNIARVSHELQTPLNLVNATAKLVSHQNKFDPKLRKYMRNIVNNCNKMTMIISNILDPDTLTLPHFEKVKIRQFFDSIYYTVRPYFRGLGVTLKLDYDTEHEYAILSPVILERIILNLMTNAIKFNKSEKKVVRFRVTDRKGYIVFSVKDNGIGISPENLEHITEEFFRVDNDFTKGIGLGLSIVKRYTERMNGKLKIKSTLGKGTEVCVYIPHKPEDNIFESREAVYTHYPEKASYDIEFSQFYDAE